MPRKPRYDREHALDSAVTLFWQRGYHASSLKHIEQALDMRPGSLYATFGSKEALFQEALDRYAARMSEDLDACLRASDSRLGGLRNYLRQLARACTTAGEGEGALTVPACMLVKTLLETNQQNEALRAQANQLLDQTEARLCTVLVEARARGELAPDADCQRLARLVQAQIMGLRSFAQRKTDAATVIALVEDMLALLDAQKPPIQCMGDAGPPGNTHTLNQVP